MRASTRCYIHNRVLLHSKNSSTAVVFMLLLAASLAIDWPVSVHEHCAAFAPQCGVLRQALTFEMLAGGPAQ